jgi:N-acyl homoserine lactone hydrolase
MKLYFLNAGRIRMRKSVYIQGADRNETFEAPVSSALIRHGQGNVLFDTGCHPSVIEHGEERWGALMKVMTPIMRAEDTLLPSLASLGLGPDDIDVVVNSHFHPDHCGCNAFFRNATIIAHAREIDAANAPDAEGAGYLRADWDHGQPMQVVTGENDVFGDGRVVLVPLARTHAGDDGRDGQSRQGRRVFSCVGRRQSAAQSRHLHGATKHLERRSAPEVVRRNPAHRTLECHRDLRPR